MSFFNREPRQPQQPSPHVEEALIESASKRADFSRSTDRDYRAVYRRKGGKRSQNPSPEIGGFWLLMPGQNN